MDFEITPALISFVQLVLALLLAYVCAVLVVSVCQAQRKLPHRAPVKGSKSSKPDVRISSYR